jgi:hypothetical protein
LELQPENSCIKFLVQYRVDIVERQVNFFVVKDEKNMIGPK